LAFSECQCSGSSTIFVSHVISNVLLVAFQCGLPKSVALAAAALLPAALLITLMNNGKSQNSNEGMELHWLGRFWVRMHFLN